jgi:cyclic beta-1,2-glucan synthetase
VDDLNRRFGPEHADRFFLCHRARRWNAQEHTWMGWERKRGKIEEFCRLLRGDKWTSFGNPDWTVPVADRIVTLDVDSRLAPGAAIALDAAIAPQAGICAPFVRVARRSRAGPFEILNTPLFEESERSATFNQGWLGHDLFQGKGLIDVDKFLDRTRGRIRERTILSHDHLESLLVGAVSSAYAVINEPFPASRERWVRRQNRWIRGDFQLLSWVLSARLPLIARVHLAENLLIHWTPVACLGTALLALMLAPPGASVGVVAWALALLRPTVFLLPVDLAFRLVGRQRWTSDRLRRSGARVYGELAPFLSALVFCGADALNTVRAAAVTLRRLGSGRDLLEWNDDAQRSSAVPCLCIVSAGVISLGAIAWHLPSAKPLSQLLILWCAGPLLVKLAEARQEQAAALAP